MQQLPAGELDTQGVALVQAVTSINGVVVGRISLEHKGAYTVRCCATGRCAALKLHAATMLTPKARMHEVGSSCS